MLNLQGVIERIKMSAESVSTEGGFEYEKYVLLPHSPYNSIVCVLGDRQVRQPRWNLIEENLTLLIYKVLSFEDDSNRLFTLIKDCIEKYNPKICCNFNLLEDLCDYGSPNDLWNLKEVICSIAKTALKLPILFPEPLLLLRTGQNVVLELTAERVHCLLANAFFCTFPKRNGYLQYKNYPKINFTKLFDDSVGSISWHHSARNAKLEKLKCFLNYFSRMSSYFNATDTIIYERRTFLTDELIDVEKSSQIFSKLNVSPSESSKKSVGCLQVDFGNKMIGGGTLGNGSAMEEIKFVTCPALVAAQLFVECLGDKDVLLVHGYEQFSTSIGYSSNFQFYDNFSDNNVCNNHIVAMDAYPYRRHETEKQFEKYYVDRELIKCLCAFKAPTDPRLPTRKLILSGKWGCGVFNGHAQLKCLIQWMAASLCDVPLELNTFGDTQLANEMNHIANVIQNRKCEVGKIYSLIIEYGNSLKCPEGGKENACLIEFIEIQLEKELLRQKNQIYWKMYFTACRVATFFVGSMRPFANLAIGIFRMFQYLPNFLMPQHGIKGQNISQENEASILLPKSIATTQTSAIKNGKPKLLDLMDYFLPSSIKNFNRKPSISDSELEFSDPD